MAKGNKIENWNDSYEDFGTTYSEVFDSPGNLANYMQHKFVLEDIRKYLPNTPDPKVLECGCGGARTLLFLAMRGVKDLTGSDYAPEAIRLSKANFEKFGKNASFVQDDLLNSGLPQDAYDCVMSFGLLEHFEDIDILCRAITRLVKPGGIQIHCIIPKKFSTQSVMNALFYLPRFIKRLVTGQTEGIFYKSFRDFPHYENTFSEEDYRRAFERAGNTIIKSEAGGVLLPFLQLPLGVGNFIVKNTSPALVWLLNRTERSQARVMHALGPTFYIVSRKNNT